MTSIYISYMWYPNKCIYFVDAKGYTNIFFCGILEERVMNTSPSFSTAYTRRLIYAHMGILLYTAVRRPPNIPYDVYIILYQHLYKYSTREYQLIINVVVTTYVHRYYPHMPCPVCCYIFRYWLGCYVICHVAR